MAQDGNDDNVEGDYSEDEIVEGCLSGDTERQRKSFRLYAEVCPLEETQLGAEPYGVIVPKTELEFNINRLEWVKDSVSTKRFAALKRGAEATEHERLAYRESVLAAVMESPAFYDFFLGIWIHRLKHTDGKEAFAVNTVTGDPLSGIESVFQGLFPSVEDALKELSKWGVIILN